MEKVPTRFTPLSNTGAAAMLRRACARGEEGVIAKRVTPEPELVAEIGISEWTSAGLLRHPRFLGLREDKPVREVRREE